MKVRNTVTIRVSMAVTNRVRSKRIGSTVAGGRQGRGVVLGSHSGEGGGCRNVEGGNGWEDEPQLLPGEKRKVKRKKKKKKKNKENTNNNSSTPSRFFPAHREVPGKL